MFHKDEGFEELTKVYSSKRQKVEQSISIHSRQSSDLYGQSLGPVGQKPPEVSYGTPLILRCSP